MSRKIEIKKKTDRTVSLVQDLFVARKDAYAVQVEGGRYETKRLPLTGQILSSHLKGEITVGVYPYSDNTTKWLVFDVDVPDANEAIQIRGRLAHHSISGYLEDSGRNWHVWGFFEKPISNHFARKLARFIVGEVGCRNAVEIFPGQDIIPNLGSCIKLPLGINRKTGKACLFVDEDLKPFEDQPGFLESIRKTTEAELKDILHANGIEINQEAARKSITTFREPCIEKYWQEGAREGQRAFVAYQIAIRFKETRRTEEDAFSQMKAWLGRCDKGTQPFTEGDLFVSVRNAYNRYPTQKACCNSTLLKKNCIGTFKCSFFINLKKRNPYLISYSYKKK